MNGTTASNGLLRLATYNVHSCVGAWGRHDPDRVAAVIAELDADVVALQEFSYPADLAIETRSADLLRSLDRYHSALGPTRARGELHYGNVLLSRHPIRALQRLDLSHRRREPRGALAALLDVRGLPLHVLVTHLGLRLSERRFQVSRILEHVAAQGSEPMAVLGDFNDWLPGRSVAHALDAVFGPGLRAPSFPARFPLVALDRVWLRPRERAVAVRAHRSRLARRASDHLPVVVDVSWD